MAPRTCLLAIGLMLATSACDKASSGKEGAAVRAEGDQTAMRLRPGLWQQSQSSTLAAAAGESATPRCVTPAEAISANGSDAEIHAALVRQAAKDGCTVQSVTIDGPTIAFTQACQGSTVSVSTEYHGDSSITKMSGAALPTMTTVGKRVGDC